MSSHACVSHGLSASASAGAPSALGVVPTVVPLAVAGDGGGCCMHDGVTSVHYV